MNIRTGRVESFSDGVISIIITIMIFDIKFPDLARHFTQHDVDLGMKLVIPKLCAYLFSFLVLGTMWVNHHHMFHLIKLVDEKLIWLNMNLLFWMSLVPFPTSMIGKNPLLPESVAIYGAVLCATSISFIILRTYVIRHELMDNDDQKFNRKIDRLNRRVRIKNIIGSFAYLLSVPLAFVSVYISFGLFLVSPMLFFIPDGIAEASDEVTNKELE